MTESEKCATGVVIEMIEVSCCSFGTVRSIALRLINSSAELFSYLMKTLMR